MTTINLPHPAAEFVADDGCAETLRGKKSDRAGFTCFDRFAREKIESQIAVADAAAFIAGGVEDRASADDPGAGKRFSHATALARAWPPSYDGGYEIRPACDARTCERSRRRPNVSGPPRDGD